MQFLKQALFKIPVGQHLFSLTIGWFLVLLIIVPVLSLLGLWQLERAEQRQQALDDFAVVMAQNPVSIDALSSKADDQRFVRVEMVGELDWSKQFLLENQVHNTVTGYEVLVPLVFAPGKAILVSRGWLARTPDSKPDVSPTHGLSSVQTLQGLAVIPKARISDYQRNILRQTQGYQEMNDNPQLAEWPVLILEEDFAVLSSLLELELVPRILQPQQDWEFGFRRVWQPSLRGPAVNYGYAAQWFGMIVLLLGLMIWFNTKRL